MTNTYITSNHGINENTSNTPQNSRSYFLNLINNQHYHQSNPTEIPEFSEIDSYLNTSNNINTDPLIW